jgi:hypothetical protein
MTIPARARVTASNLLAAASSSGGSCSALASLKPTLPSVLAKSWMGGNLNQSSRSGMRRMAAQWTSLSRSWIFGPFSIRLIWGWVMLAQRPTTSCGMGLGWYGWFLYAATTSPMCHEPRASSMVATDQNSSGRSGASLRSTGLAAEHPAQAAPSYEPSTPSADNNTHSRGRSARLVASRAT